MFLNAEQATTFRALAAKANYLALDRPDLAFAAKELCRAFAQPTATDVIALKRLVRYLKGRTRMVYSYDFPEHIDGNNGGLKDDNEEIEITVYVDTDLAGCAKTRRSTSGGALAMHPSLLKHWSVTQTAIALSSGEAELTGIVKGTTYGLGFRSLAADLGISLSLGI